MRTSFAGRRLFGSSFTRNPGAFVSSLSLLPSSSSLSPSPSVSSPSSSSRPLPSRPLSSRPLSLPSGFSCPITNRFSILNSECECPFLVPRPRLTRLVPRPRLTRLVPRPRLTRLVPRPRLNRRFPVPFPRMFPYPAHALPGPHERRSFPRCLHPSRSPCRLPLASSPRHPPMFRRICSSRNAW